MADIFPLRASEHDQVQQLLPWYVNGTLSEEESGRVEAHLAQCAECREELEFDRKLALDIATLPLNVDESWHAMGQRIADQRPSNVVQGRFGVLKRSVPVGWTAVSSLAAAALAVVVVTSLRPAAPAEQTYRALGSAPSAATGQVVVLFKPDTTEQQMRVLLSAQDARVVDGPTAAGAYVLRIENGSPERALPALRQSSQVVLAEAIANDGRP